MTCPNEDAEPYPIDDCACRTCRLVHAKLCDLTTELLEADVDPWSIATVTARWLGMFTGFHVQEGRDPQEIVAKLHRLVEARAMRGVIESAALEAEEATRQ